QRPEIMGQFVACVEGIAEACRALDFPVVSGNVSLYNETKNEDGTSTAILPTPAIGGVGLLDDWEKSATIGFKGAEHVLYLIGGPTPHSYDNWVDEAGQFQLETHDPAIPNGQLGQSLWLSEIYGRRDGSPPAVDLESERRAGEFVRKHIRSGEIRASHDVSDGGILVAVAEMALASGIGAKLHLDDPFNELQAAFGENQGRYIVAVERDESGYLGGVGFHLQVLRAGLACWALGQTGGDALVLANPCSAGFQIPLADLRAAHEGFFPKLMGSELTPGF
ncbi:MAG: AIR synthase-related protein, partial [Sphingomicrobium sp.]